MVDNFAGGGGASTGMSMATGKEIDIAINHNAEALAMHEKNHPGTKHFCESVFDVDPMTATKGRSAWFGSAQTAGITVRLRAVSPVSKAFAA